MINNQAFAEPNGQPFLMSPAQAALSLGVSRSYLDKKRVSGGGPSYIKLGRNVRYYPAELERWVLEHKRDNTSQAGPTRL